jgi:hypothetical protein
VIEYFGCVVPWDEVVKKGESDPIWLSIPHISKKTKTIIDGRVRSNLANIFIIHVNLTAKLGFGW